MAHRRFYVFTTLFAVISLIAAVIPTRPATAQSSLAAELTSLINALRAARGLAPYTVDSQLTAMAQQHSAYQASIHTSTHQHSNGQNPPQLGVVENVAGGTLGGLTAETIIYEIWADAVHLKTMVGYSAGSMGVGVADDGETVYVTLEVRPAGGSSSGSSGSSRSANNPTPFTPIPIAPLATTTPRPDGAIVHQVGYGQTLWAIALAYGVKIDQLRAWNNLAEGSNEIYAGQWLLVRPASLAPPTPAATETAVATAIKVAMDSTILESPSSTKVVTATPGLISTKSPESTETYDPAAQSGSSSGAWLPLLAGLSILSGVALIIFFGRTKRTKS